MGINTNELKIDPMQIDDTTVDASVNPTNPAPTS